jgi:CHASE2 domain-containing sensor protein
MNLLCIWVSFIILINVCEELDLLDYFLLSILMLGFTVTYNLKKPSKISFATKILLWSLPNCIICYVMFIYGNFLLVLN